MSLRRAYANEPAQNTQRIGHDDRGLLLRGETADRLPLDMRARYFCRIPSSPPTRPPRARRFQRAISLASRFPARPLPEEEDADDALIRRQVPAVGEIAVEKRVANAGDAFRKRGGRARVLGRERRRDERYLTLAFLCANYAKADIVHAGSYFGDFLPALSRAVAPDARIWAFKPSRENFSCAEITLKLNGIQNVALSHAALGAAAGSAQLCARKAERRASRDGSAIAADKLPGFRYEEVEVVTVDEAVPSGRSVPSSTSMSNITSSRRLRARLQRSGAADHELCSKPYPAIQIGSRRTSSRSVTRRSRSSTRTVPSARGRAAYSNVSCAGASVSGFGCYESMQGHKRFRRGAEKTVRREIASTALA